MAPELGLTGFSDHIPDAVDSDRNTNLLAGDLFDPGLFAIDGASLFQDVFWLTQPFPPPTCEAFPIFSRGILSDASPEQVVERNAFPPLPPVPGVSTIPQAATMLASNAMKNCHPCHERTTGVELALTGEIHTPVTVHTIPLLSPSSSLTLTFPANWVKIPQTSYGYGSKQLDFNPLDPISFTTKDHPGINLRDALRKDWSLLNCSDDLMLPNTSGVISCRLLFPGYLDNGSSCQIHTLNWTKTRIPISRGKLAHQVARKVNSYLTRMARITPDGSAETCWRIGQGFMHIENMYLVSLVSVSKGSFQPEIYAEIPSVPCVCTDEGRC